MLIEKNVTKLPHKMNVFVWDPDKIHGHFVRLHFKHIFTNTKMSVSHYLFWCSNIKWFLFFQYHQPLNDDQVYPTKYQTYRQAEKVYTKMIIGGTIIFKDHNQCRQIVWVGETLFLKPMYMTTNSNTFININKSSEKYII